MSGFFDNEVEIECRSFPSEGAYRIHIDPARLPQEVPEGHRPPHRFDDSQREYLVRYAGKTLYESAIEVLAHWRTSQIALARASMIQDADDDIFPPPPHAVPGQWFEMMRIGRLYVDEKLPFADVGSPRTLSTLNMRARVRRALEDSSLSGEGFVPDLDEGVIRLGGPVGRPITQAVAREIYEADDRIGGIRYTSRLDASAECWAVFDRCPHHFGAEYENLSPHDPAHAKAFRQAARALKVTLPEAWQELEL